MNKSIFVLGYYGWSNTGDDAMLYSLLTYFEELTQNTDFIVLSQKDIYIPILKKNTIIYINYKKILSVLKRISKSSIFVLGGGTHLYDYGNHSNRFIRLLQLYLLIKFSKVCNNKIAYIGIGIEKPETMWGKFFIKQICKLADYIIVRDSNSFSLLKQWKIVSNIEQAGDLAISLKKKLPLTVASNPNRKVLGISVLPFFQIYYNNDNLDKEFLIHLAYGLTNWLENDPQSYIYLFVFKGKSKNDDARFTEKLKSFFYTDSRIKIIDYNKNPLITLSNVAECNYFIGMRYHSCVFAYIANIPFLTINYAQKNQFFVLDYKIPKKSTIEINDILDNSYLLKLDEFQKDPYSFHTFQKSTVWEQKYTRILKQILE
jgi:polysaccharide pyruvyl transferase WcaK-like protein